MNEAFSIVKTDRNDPISIQSKQEFKSIGHPDDIKNSILLFFPKIHFEEVITGIYMNYHFEYDDQSCFFEISYMASHQYEKIRSVDWIGLSFNNNLALEKLIKLADRYDAKVLDIENMIFVALRK